MELVLIFAFLGIANSLISKDFSADVGGSSSDAEVDIRFSHFYNGSYGTEDIMNELMANKSWSSYKKRWVKYI